MIVTVCDVTIRRRREVEVPDVCPRCMRQVSWLEDFNVVYRFAGIVDNDRRLLRDLGNVGVECRCGHVLAAGTVTEEPANDQG